MLLEITVALTLGIGPPTLDLNANVVLPLTRNGWGYAWIPHVAVYDPEVEWIGHHEMKHLNQWTALGPAFPVAYALTAGREFENYIQDTYMWVPDNPMRCPLLRIRDGIHFMPCWRF